MRKIYDFHVHTNHSIDADKSDKNSILMLSEKAKSMGYSGIAFTDHFDADLVLNNIEPHESKAIKSECDKAKSLHNDDNFKVYHGIEIGTQRYFRDFCADNISEHGYDVVISSIHTPKGNINYMLSQIDFGAWEDDKIVNVFDIYMDDLLFTATHCDFDILAHITYPLRYFRRFGKDHLVPIEKYADMYDEIFRQLISRGKALEINTSGLRQGHGETYPNIPLIKRYIELGGELFTIGSDSHNPYDIFSDIEKVGDTLALIGAKYLCYYENRKPNFIKL